MKRFLRTRWIQSGLIFLCGLFLLLAHLFSMPGINSLINRFDSLIYDEMLRWYPNKFKELARVVIIDIDDVSLFKEGRWPWPRNKLAALLLKLQEAGVVVVGIDIIMSDPEVNYAISLKDKLTTDLADLPVAEKTQLAYLLQQIAPKVDNDQKLVEVMSGYDVSLGFLFHDLSSVKVGLLPKPLTNKKGELLRPEQFDAQRFQGYDASLGLFIKASGHGGFVTNLPDFDGVIRHGLVLGSIDNQVYPSLALMTTMRYLLADYVSLKVKKTLDGEQLYGLDVGGTFVPTNRNGQILIPFWGPQFTLPYYSATDVIQGKIEPTELEGAVAIVGSSAVVLGDLHASPVAKLFPGVEMVGNMVAAMLGQQISTQYNWSSISGLIIFIIFTAFFALIIPLMNIALLIVIPLVLFGLLLLSFIFLFYKNLFIPVGAMMILVSTQSLLSYFYEFIMLKSQKFKMKQLFGQYVPENYVTELLESGAEPTMDGQTREMSVLFSDIRNFTATSEKLTAAKVKQLLNSFFTPVTEIIFNYQGTIDKYVGDLVIAFWGAPIPIANNGHAYQVIAASLHIFNDLPKINQQLKEQGLPALNIGIGIGTGIMNVGDMGSKFRRAYTVLGDVVNLTSRLESLSKYYQVNIIANEETRIGQNAFLWRTLDRVSVKGRKEATLIYEPLGYLKEMSAEKVDEINLYHQALSQYFAQNWEEADSLFKQLQKQDPSTYLYELYINRIVFYKNTPPPKQWDGVHVHQEK